MLDKVKELIGDVKAFEATSKEDVEAFRIKYLGSKGLLKDLFKEFEDVSSAISYLQGRINGGGKH